MLRAPRILFAAAALAYSAVPAAAAPFSDPSRPVSCSKPEYPPQSLERHEDGVTVLAFLVRADGTVERSVILGSSGSADLDRAAAQALSKCVFKPASDGGPGAGSWVRTEYRWLSDDDPELSRAKQRAAIAGDKGSLAARYRLSVLLSATAATDADRELALVVLRSAAGLGSAPAQFDLGRKYEKGDGIKADPAEALRWYRKAAAQGDVLAIQRLELGVLPD